MATENGTFSYQPTTSGIYTWSFRMKNSGTVAQPASVYYLDNLQVSYPYPYTRIDCEKGPNASYRFGFNGKEKESDLYGESNAYDFGDRMYDSRIARWNKTDLKQFRYPSWSPYHFGYNSPIITIDPDGKENIVVVGGIDKGNKNQYNFISSGLKSMNSFIESEPKEHTQLVVMTANMLPEQITEIATLILKMQENGNNVDVTFVDNADQLTNYLNYKTKNPEESSVSNARDGDKITDMRIFGHGYRPEWSSEGNYMGSFESGHGGNTEVPENPNSERPIHNKWAWGKSDIDGLKKEAFAKNSNIIFFTCNSATNGTLKTNLAQYMSKKTGGKVTGFFGRVNYGNINDLSNRICRKLGQSGISPSSNLPSEVGGNKSDNSGSTEKKTYNNGI